MGNDYFLRVATSKDLGNEAFVHSFLTDWRSDPGLYPEFFGLGEPIRRKFESGTVDAAAQLWLGQQMPVMLRRQTKPRFVADIWWRPDKGADPRPYPWGCHVFLSQAAGDELALRLFGFLVDHFEPAFGSIATVEDSRAKHQVAWREGDEHVSQHMGLDVGKFVTTTIDYGREVLPGIYWVTYFGPGAAELVGRAALECLEADRVERLRSGFLVRAYPSARASTTQPAHAAEAQIMKQLGREHFFDKLQVDVESLNTDEVTAARVERKVAAIKAART